MKISEEEFKRGRIYKNSEKENDKFKKEEELCRRFQKKNNSSSEEFIGTKILQRNSEEIKTNKKENEFRSK